MKKTSLFILGFVFTLSVFSQKDTQILLSINGDKISVAEFKKVYEKNLNAIDNEEGKDVAKNLELYINYKLKVAEAYELKLDTLKSYKREIETYRNQLTAPYLQDKEHLEALIKEAYDRTKTEIKARHILFRLPQKYEDKDTLAIYNKALEARNRILNGEDFEKVAKEVSEDQSAKTNGGDLGYFSAFKMIYDFENVAYNTKETEISMPFKTRFGYHILQRTGTRMSKGERQAAHIQITDTTKVGTEKINEVYAKLVKGESFKELAKEYSDDTNSKNKGGLLPKFGSGRMVPEIEKAVFSLENNEDYSKPFKTRFGWHIVKLIEKFPVLSYNEMKKELADKVKGNGRSRFSDQAVVEKLKEEYTITEYPTTKSFIQKKGIRNWSKDSLGGAILKINDKLLTQQDYVKYINNRRHLFSNVLYQNFINHEVLAYYKENLPKTNPEFAATLKEYEDGLLLFELMQQKVWNKSNDSTAIASFFDKNQKKYNTKDLSKVRGKVMSDYQDYLEKNWIQTLRGKNKVKINKRILKKLEKFYRKES